MTINSPNLFHLILAGGSYILVILITANLMRHHTREENLRLALALSFGVSSFIFILPIITEWKLMNLKNPASIFEQRIILYFFTEYMLISLSVIYFTAYKKNGLENLKEFKLPGLRYAMFAGLICGSVLGSVLGVIIGQLLKTPISGITIGSITGLSLGLVCALIFGLRDEYEKEKVVAWW